jgi:hypothetical protein
VNDGKCEVHTEINCISFDSVSYEKVYDGFEIFAGATRDLEVDDPTLIYQRGLWFDGNDFLTLEGLSLH